MLTSPFEFSCTTTSWFEFVVQFFVSLTPPDALVDQILISQRSSPSQEPSIGARADADLFWIFDIFSHDFLPLLSSVPGMVLGRILLLLFSDPKVTGVQPVPRLVFIES